MVINNDVCQKCGKCVIECANIAIRKNDDGNYIIDPSLCNNCKDSLDIECIRHCTFKAITHEDGTVPEFDTTKRLLSNHVAWIIAIMGARGNTTRFPVDNREWKEFRKLIASAYIDPDLKIRIVYGHDDICITCGRKQTGCRESAGGPCFERLGIEAGTIIKFWDLVKLVEDKYSLSFLKQFDYDDEYLACFRTFVSPDAKFLSNE